MSVRLFSVTRNHSVTFPKEIFGLCEIAAKEYKETCSEDGFSLDEYKKLIIPYPPIYFAENTAEVASSEEEATQEMPWTLAMIEKTKAFKERRIRGQTKEQKDTVRRESGKELYEKPEDFEAKYKVHKSVFDALDKPFKAQTREECDEFVHKLGKVINSYNIVNIALPEYKKNVPKFVKNIDIKRQQIVLLIEDLFEKDK